jgi:hypothetical protein
MNSQELQKKFVDHIRKGIIDNFPEVDQNACIFYHQHLKKKLSRLLSHTFPLTKEALDDRGQWEKAVASFLANSSAPKDTPFNLSHAFSSYIFNSLEENQGHPYLKDLLNFERQITEIFYMENIPSPPFTSNGNRLESAVVLNPEHCLIQFEYPVFKYKASELAPHKGSYYLLLYRHKHSFNVELVELSELYFLALAKMAHQPIPLLSALEAAADHLKIEADNIDPAEALDFFDSMHAQGAFLGFASDV